MIVLDTDHISVLEWAESETAGILRRRLARVDASSVFATIISYEEQIRGWMSHLAKYKTLFQHEEAYSRLLRQLRNYCAMRILRFDEQAALLYQRFKSQRVRIGTMDLKIAAICRTHDALLLSRNLADFRQVPGLRVEDWTSEA